MGKLLLTLCLLSFGAFAEDVPMSSLSNGQELRVSMDGETYTKAFFKSECFIPTEKGLESMALIELEGDNGELLKWNYTTTTGGDFISSTVLNAGSVCKENGDRAYLVPKSQLLGLLTQLANINASGGNTMVALRAMSSLFDKQSEVGAELAEIRRIIVNED
ncbi:MAG: hypothetical protein JKX87_06285 [Cycloclasticus sp.]|nr:hypothetical protein [Cycloclasticus sp.]